MKSFQREENLDMNPLPTRLARVAYVGQNLPFIVQNVLKVGETHVHKWTTKGLMRR